MMLSLLRWLASSPQDRLNRACERGDLVTVKSILEGHQEQQQQWHDDGGDLRLALLNGRSSGDGHERTPLHWAAMKGHLDVVRYLLDKGAELEVKADMDFTPLHAAVFYDRIPVVEHLVDREADLESVTDKLWTPLHLAAGLGWKLMVLFLLSRGANLEVRDHRGLIALDEARAKGLSEIVECLDTEATDRAQESVTSGMVPGPPTIQAVIPGDASLTIIFTPPPQTVWRRWFGRGGPSISGYVIRIKPGNRLVYADSSDSPCTITNLINGLVYRVAVRSVNGVSKGKWSPESIGVRPGPGLGSSIGAPLHYQLSQGLPKAPAKRSSGKATTELDIPYGNADEHAAISRKTLAGFSISRWKSSDAMLKASRAMRSGVKSQEALQRVLSVIGRARWHPSSTSSGSTPSRGNNKAKEALIVPDEFSCPLTLELMKDPVVAEDGHSYEREAITGWINTATTLTSPLLHTPMGPSLRPNTTLRKLIEDFIVAHHQQPVDG